MRVRYVSKVRQGYMYAFMALVLAGIITWGVVLVRQQAAAAGELVFTGNASIVGDTDVFIPITNVSIQGDSSGDIPLSIVASEGVVRFGSTTGLTFNGRTSGKSVSFTGTKEAINDALQTLQYRANAPAVEAAVAIKIGSEDMVFYPGNGHVYEVVQTENAISWTQAKALAEARTFNGATGYLATITDQGENDYITARMSGDGWFGASDQAVEGEWRWVTGPEAGTQFWQGLGVGTGGGPVNGLFSNWDTAEPNNAGNEDCAQFYGDGRGWNDLDCDTPSLSSYVVEYGDSEVLPTPPSSVELSFTTERPEPRTVTLDSCQDFFDEYVGDNQHRYDTINLTRNLDCTGYSITSLFSEYDEDNNQALAFEGTFNGNGHTISNLTIEPRYNEYIEGYNPSGLFGYVDGGTINQLKLENISVSGSNCVGGVVGYGENVTITNTQVSGTISPADEGWFARMGGIIGCLYGDNKDSTINTVEFSGTIDLEEGDDIGGIVGIIEVGGGSEVTVQNASSRNATLGGDYSVGGIVGLINESSNEDVTKVTVRNTTSGTINLPDARVVGGLVGYAYIYSGSLLDIESNTLTGPITGYRQVGGIAGYLESYENGSLITVKQPTVNQAVTALDSWAGGVVGITSSYAEDQPTILIDRPRVTAPVTGEEYVGGVIGEAEGESEVESAYTTVLNRAYVNTTVSSTDDNRAGGLVGQAEGVLISQSYVRGAVSGANAEVGGLAGMTRYSKIEDSYSRASVQGVESVGGLIGLYDYNSVIENSYATGVVTAEAGTGGLVGVVGNSSGVSTVASYWDTQTTAQSNSLYGTGKTTAEMKNRTTYTSWDFDTVWAMSASVNNGYPCLQWTGTCAQDGDSDGISNAVENAAPNAGDGNNDGIQDAEQSNVASFVNPLTGTYATIAIDDSCELVAVSSEAESSSVKDNQYTYQAGLLGFTANCSEAQVDVKVYQYGMSADGLVLRKFNPNTGVYFTVQDANLSTQTIGGQTVAVAQYTVVDGGELDIDGTANGQIIDPVGFASLATDAPNTGFGQDAALMVRTAGTFLLGLAIVVLGAIGYRFYKRA